MGSGKIPRNPLAHVTEELQVALGTGDFREAESIGQSEKVEVRAGGREQNPILKAESQRRVGRGLQEGSR